MRNENPIESASREPPTLRTDWLIVRPWQIEDAPILQQLAGAWEIADTTLNIPYPYEDGESEKWIGGLREKFQQGKEAALAITLADNGIIVGCIGLTIDQRHQRGEIGYWIGHQWWGKGYCAQAARMMLGFGSEQLGLHRIVGHHLTRNPASGRVMQKIGMKHEGTLRQHAKKWDKFEDIECYGILVNDS